MKIKLLLLLTGTLGSSAALAQTGYTGTVGTAPIILTLDDTGDKTFLANAVYCYTKYGTPIALWSRRQSSTLTLTETDGHGKPTGIFTFERFSPSQPQCSGSWRNPATGQQVPVHLTRQPGKLLQAAATPLYYFQAIPLADSPGYLAAVEVYEKGTNRLVQRLVLEECRASGSHSLDVGDYNFDGQPDISFLSETFAGPNTTSSYFLYQPTTHQFVESGFSGTSLEFDAKKKRITENNSAAAGSSVTKVIYKLVNNRMVAESRHCYRWNEKLQKLVEQPWSACE